MTSIVIAIVLISDSSMGHKVTEVLDLMTYKQHITKKDPVPKSRENTTGKFSDL
jgi:hypothetical protein